MTSREQRLITKEQIATHTNLFLWFNPGTFVINKYYALILTVTLQASLSCKLRDAHGTPTFNTEAIRILSNVATASER